jgi:hypothetical protein
MDQTGEVELKGNYCNDEKEENTDNNQQNIEN